VEEAEEDRVIEVVIEGMPVIAHTEGLVAGELLYATIRVISHYCFRGRGRGF